MNELLRIRGGGGGTSLPGAPDQSVPMAIGVGMRSGVLNHSWTLLCLQKIGRLEITSAPHLRLHEHNVQRYPEATCTG